MDKIIGIEEFQRIANEQKINRKPGAGPYTPPFVEGSIIIDNKNIDNVKFVPHTPETPISNIRKPIDKSTRLIDKVRSFVKKTTW